MNASSAFRMTDQERRSSVSLAGLYILRMLGLFLVLPVFAVAAQGLPGGSDPAKIGLALGMYGFTQALMQIPFGVASDRWGRRPVVVAGMLLFVLGSLICTLADDLFWITVGRAIQGAGAISAAVTAWLADSTRDEVRTKAMALIGASIGLTFAVSLVLAPLIVGWGGLTGLFGSITALGVAALLVAAFVIPTPTAPAPATAPVGAGHAREPNTFRQILAHPDLFRLNVGILVLHLVQIALFVAIPAALVQTGGLDAGALWKVYLPVVSLSFVFMLPIIGLTERFRAHRRALLAAVLALALVCAALVWTQHHFIGLILSLLLFFTAFNTLEALQPSLVSRVAPPHLKGAALGVFNTCQAIGLFLGGAVGGWLIVQWGQGGMYWVCAVLALIWLLVAWGMKPLPARAKQTAQ